MKEYKAKIEFEGGTKEYSLEDMAEWYKEIRTFRTILFFGKGSNQIAGEGQSGGRAVSEVAKAVENDLIKHYGEDEYIKRIDKLIGG